MQLLIDATQETPGSLRLAATLLVQMADFYAQGDTPPIECAGCNDSTWSHHVTCKHHKASINGKPEPIVLHSTTHAVGDVSITEQRVTGLDPSTVFGMPKAAEYVPTGTTAAEVSSLGLNVLPFPLPTVPTAPAAPNVTPPAPAMSFADLAASVLPAVTTTPPTVSDVTTTTATTAPTPVVPVAATPDATAPVPVSSVATVECDKEGLPWDARVHSETRKFNADGTWRYRRNLDPVIKATVHAELKAQYGRQVPLVPAVPLAPAYVAGTQLVPQSAVPLPAGAIPTAPVAPQPPAAVPLPPAANVGVPNSTVQTVVSTTPVTGFRDLMSKVNKAQSAGLLTQVQLSAFCTAVGLDSVTALASQPAKVGLVDAQVNDHLLRGAATA